MPFCVLILIYVIHHHYTKFLRPWFLCDRARTRLCDRFYFSKRMSTIRYSANKFRMEIFQLLRETELNHVPPRQPNFGSDRLRLKKKKIASLQSIHAIYPIHILITIRYISGCIIIVEFLLCLCLSATCLHKIKL